MAVTCPHRHVEDDGVRVEKTPTADGWKREAWILSTCRQCGQRFRERWEMRRVEKRRTMAPNEDNR